MSALSPGLTAGVNTAMSQTMGSGRAPSHIRRLLLHSGAVALSLGLVVGVLFWLGTPLLFSMLGARGAVLDTIVSYMPCWSASFLLLAVTMVLEATFRAHGDGTRAAGVMVLSAVFNIALTSALIFGHWNLPVMGMAGAGLATLLACGCGLAFAVVMAARSGHL